MSAPPRLPAGLRATLEVVRALESVGARYFLGGSLASSIHGLARTTLDADIAAELSREQVQPFLAAVQADFFVEPERVEQAIARRGSFNLIHLRSPFKVDVFVLREDALATAAMQRRQRIALPSGDALYVATPEDILLEKLRWYRLGNEVSQRQWGDVLGVISVQGARLDRGYLEATAEPAGLMDLLRRALAEASSA